MTKAIQQSVRFSMAARMLYKSWVDPKQHGAFTGGPAKIGPNPGDKFSAFEGMIFGETIFSVPGRLLVMRWRSKKFKKNDPDSILVIEFVQEGRSGRIDLVHVNVPAHDHADVTKGWNKYYWGPLRGYLRRCEGKRSR